MYTTQTTYCITWSRVGFSHVTWMVNWRWFPPSNVIVDHDDNDLFLPDIVTNPVIGQLIPGKRRAKTLAKQWLSIGSTSDIMAQITRKTGQPLGIDHNNHWYHYNRWWFRPFRTHPTHKVTGTVLLHRSIVNYCHYKVIIMNIWRQGIYLLAAATECVRVIVLQLGSYFDLEISLVW